MKGKWQVFSVAFSYHKGLLLTGLDHETFKEFQWHVFPVNAGVKEFDYSMATVDSNAAEMFSNIKFEKNP